ncbi:MAG: hypothetical protein AAEJ52_10665, partial [Myxococcota bacterium]
MLRPIASLWKCRPDEIATRIEGPIGDANLVDLWWGLRRQQLDAIQPVTSAQIDGDLIPVAKFIIRLHGKPRTVQTIAEDLEEKEVEAPRVGVAHHGALGYT